MPRVKILHSVRMQRLYVLEVIVTDGKNKRFFACGKMCEKLRSIHKTTHFASPEFIVALFRENVNVKKTQYFDS